MVFVFRPALVLISALVLAAHGGSFAQDATSRQTEAGKTSDMDNWKWKAQQGVQHSAGTKAAQLVVDAITAKDCSTAVGALNAGLAKSHVEVLVLAGALFEGGICVKPSWERASRMFERAHAAGSPVAAAKLASGYATSAAGPDLGSAMWWAVTAKTPMPSICNSVAPLVTDADKFVSALNAWPNGRLQQCAYAGAVMASIQSEALSPELQAALGVQGVVKARFAPASGQVEFAQDLAVVSTGGLQTNDVTDRERSVRIALMAQLRSVADRAVGQHAKPAGIAADWVVNAEFQIKPRG